MSFNNDEKFLKKDALKNYEIFLKEQASKNYEICKNYKIFLKRHVCQNYTKQYFTEVYNNKLPRYITIFENEPDITNFKKLENDLEDKNVYRSIKELNICVFDTFEDKYHLNLKSNCTLNFIERKPTHIFIVDIVDIIGIKEYLERNKYETISSEDICSQLFSINRRD